MQSAIPNQNSAIDQDSANLFTRTIRDYGLMVHRFYIATGNWRPDNLVLTNGEAHHAREVLRLKLGDKAVLFNGRGREITAEITQVGKREVRFSRLSEAETPPLRCHITLAQAIPKGKNMDLIVQKAVEIGASEIAPLISDRTIVGLTVEEAAHKREKWQVTAIEAAKQCGQNWVPQIRTPQNLKSFFSSASVAAVSDRRTLTSLRLIGSLQPGAQHLKNVLREYEADHGERPASVLMLIGPEGDFTPAELALARSHGCQPITLGPIILRVETAAIYCLSVLSYELL